MSDGTPRGIVASANPMPKWFENAFGIVQPDPFDTDPDELAERGARQSRLLYERLGDVGLGASDSEPRYSFPIIDGRVVMASAYGGGEATWRPDVAGYWVDGHPWADISSVAEVKQLKIPNWDNEPLIQKMAARCEEVRSRAKYALPGDDTPTGWLDYPLNYPSPPRKYLFSHFASFIDLCPFLMGPEQFFVTLVADAELGRALLEKCFELVTSYFDYMRKVYNRREITALGSFGGDNSCALSPQQYRDYAVPFDMMLVERYGDVPINLHSCGPSAHLYDVWADYPNAEKIVFMQTRGIEGEADRLRKALPNAVLQITIHPPHFDFEYETPENIRRVIWHYAEAVGFRDAIMQVLFVENNERVDRNVRAVYQVVDEINRHLAGIA